MQILLEMIFISLLSTPFVDFPLFALFSCYLANYTSLCCRLLYLTFTCTPRVRSPLSSHSPLRGPTLCSPLIGLCASPSIAFYILFTFPSLSLFLLDSSLLILCPISLSGSAHPQPSISLPSTSLSLPIVGCGSLNPSCALCPP